MPYTPPSQRSPAVSAAHTPAVSRRPSHHHHHHPAPLTHHTTKRPELPRSTSYLTRHRRTPSVQTDSITPPTEHIGEPSPPGTADGEKHDAGTLTASESIRGSPQPVTEDSRLPAGVVLSPPESAHNSSDEEEEKTRGRKIRSNHNLDELKEAIKVIEQHRQSSPNRQAADVAKVNKALSLIVPRETDQKPTEEHIEEVVVPAGNRNGHQRSHTDPFVEYRNETLLTNSDDDSSDDSDVLRMKPPMVRKKSGELVRPALRPPSAKRRPSSMPGTPTYSKAVHFDAHLEHVRHFLQVDRPLAVSASSSPVETYAGEAEFPFGDDALRSRSPPFQWELVVANFPKDTPERLHQTVRLERVFLSTDNKTMIGSVAVANLGFQKTVIARFTLDYWKTTSEVVAEYNNDVRRKQQADGYDRFNFTIKLADLANLETKTMFFCIKYCVNGQEYWDNNSTTNYQVDFHKKALPQNGKNGMQGASSRPARGLPRSNKTAPPAAFGRPKPAPAFDDFGDGFDSQYTFSNVKPAKELFEDTPNPSLRLKGVKSAVSLASDNLTRRSTNGNGQAFSNRYDFGASLSAAIQAANNVMGEKSGLSQPKSQNGSKRPAPMVAPPSEPPKFAPAAPSVTAGSSGTDSPRPAGSEKPGLASQSYTELLDKYCFYGSVKSSPQLKDGTLTTRPAQYDGNSDGYNFDSKPPSPTQPATRWQPPQRPSPPRMDSSPPQRSTSPAPMTGFVTGTSPTYPYNLYGTSMFSGTHSITAIRG